MADFVVASTVRECDDSRQLWVSDRNFVQNGRLRGVGFGSGGDGGYGFWGAEFHVEGRSFADLAFCPDGSLMASHDALYGCEADAGPGELGFCMQALEGFKEPIYEALVEAGAVIADEVDGFLALFSAAKFNAGVRRTAGELPCIPEQVLQHDLHETSIGDDVAAGLDDALDLAVRVSGGEVVENG